MSREIWKDIPGMEGRYQASSLGRIRGLLEYNAFKKGRILSGNIGTNGRRSYYIARNGEKQKRVLGYRLIAEAFFGKPKKGFEINHIDADKLNDRIDNLEYVTREENYSHARKMGLYHRGTKVKVSKLTEKKIIQIRAFKGIIGLTEISKKYKVSKTTIWNIQTFRTWRWV